LLFCGLGGRDAFAQAGPRAERFVQFADFLHDIAAADLAGYSALPETRVRTSEAFEEMRRHLLSLYEAVTAEGVHSFVLDAQTFDCTVSIAGAVGAGEGLAQQFNQRVVPTLDTPQSASGGAGGF